MTVEELMAELEAKGTEQNRKVYKKHGATGPIFGVSFAHLNALKKKSKKNHSIAKQLWATNNIDAQTLATMIADPTEFSRADLEEWVTQIRYYVISDKFNAEIVRKSDYMMSCLERWTQSEAEYVKRCGFGLLTGLAKTNPQLPDSLFEPYLAQIKSEIQTSPNRAKQSMNAALITIGIRNQNLYKQALEITNHIGLVEIDHGETNCRSYDAREEIEKKFEMN